MYEMKRHYQRANNFRQDQRYRGKCFPEDVRGKEDRILYAHQLVEERMIIMDCEVPEMSHKRHFFKMC